MQEPQYTARQDTTCLCSSPRRDGAHPPAEHNYTSDTSPTAPCCSAEEGRRAAPRATTCSCFLLLCCYIHAHIYNHHYDDKTNVHKSEYVHGDAVLLPVAHTRRV